MPSKTIRIILSAWSFSGLLLPENIGKKSAIDLIADKIVDCLDVHIRSNDARSLAAGKKLKPGTAVFFPV
jgi:hypothetical protein